MKYVASLFVVCAALVACGSLVGIDEADSPIGAGASSGNASSSGGAGASSSGTGQVDVGGMTIKPAELGLPSVNCGQSTTGVITLVNNSGEEQTYEASIAGSDVFKVTSKPSGTVKARDTVTLTIEAKNPKAGPAAAEVVIKTSTSVASVSVTAESKGATLSIKPVAADFGSVKQNTVPTAIGAIFANEGTEPVEITGFTGTGKPDEFTYPASVLVPPGNVTQFVSMKGAPIGDGLPITAVLTPVIANPAVLCGATPPTITLSGQRVSDDVVVNPASAAFGTTDCNATTSTTSQNKITISNFSQDNSATYTTKLPADSRFKVNEPSGTVPKGSGGIPNKLDLLIDLVNAKDKFGPISETLEVTVTPAGGAPKTYPVALTMDVFGADLEYDPQSLVNIESGESKTADIKNAGNSIICVGFQSDNNRFVPDNSAVVFTGSPIFGGGSVRVGYSKGGSPSGTITMTRRSCPLPIRGGQFCKPPPTLSVTGQD